MQVLHSETTRRTMPVYSSAQGRTKAGQEESMADERTLTGSSGRKSDVERLHELGYAQGTLEELAPIERELGEVGTPTMAAAPAGEAR